MYVPHFVYPLMDIWVVSIFWLLWIMLPYICMKICVQVLYGYYVFTSLEHIGVLCHRNCCTQELLGHMLTIFNWRTGRLFSKISAQFYILVLIFKQFIKYALNWINYIRNKKFKQHEWLKNEKETLSFTYYKWLGADRLLWTTGVDAYIVLHT